MKLNGIIIFLMLMLTFTANAQMRPMAQKNLVIKDLRTFCHTVNQIRKSTSVTVQRENMLGRKLEGKFHSAEFKEFFTNFLKLPKEQRYDAINKYAQEENKFTTWECKEFKEFFTTP
ncbi:MAG: hypothetical protein WCG27_11040 [Pseudomonadota bacterium]